MIFGGIECIWRLEKLIFWGRVIFFFKAMLAQGAGFLTREKKKFKKKTPKKDFWGY